MKTLDLSTKNILSFIFCTLLFNLYSQTIPQKSLSFSFRTGTNSGFCNEPSTHQKYSAYNPSINFELKYMRNKNWGISGDANLDIFSTKGKINQHTALISPTLQFYLGLHQQPTHSTKKSRNQQFYHFGAGPGLTTNQSMSKRDIVFIATHGYTFQKTFPKTFWNLQFSQDILLNQSYKLDLLSSNKNSMNTLFRIQIGMGFTLYNKYYSYKNRLDTTY